MKAAFLALAVAALSLPVFSQARTYELRVKRTLPLPLGKINRELRWGSESHPHGVILRRVVDGGWSDAPSGYTRSQRLSYKRSGPGRGRPSPRIAKGDLGTTWAAFASGKLSAPGENARRLRR